MGTFEAFYENGEVWVTGDEMNRRVVEEIPNNVDWRLLRLETRHQEGKKVR